MPSMRTLVKLSGLVLVGLALAFVGIQIADLGMDYIEKRPSLINSITLAEANRVAQRLFRADDLTVIVVGDPKGMEEKP